jgi:cyclin B
MIEQAVDNVAHRATKKRKSEPESDPMQVDEADIDMGDNESEAMDADAIDIDQDSEGTSASVPSGVEDIDLYDWDDPQAVTEYVDDIYDYMREIELRYMVNPRYMANQVDINEKMRSILLDWLVEVHRMFKLLPETLFLAVNLIDRFLEVKSVARDKLQLVGVTAMLIASKYEEIYAPECNDFVYISDGAYSKEMILNMESNILSSLQFNLNAPSPLHFLRRYSKAAASDYTIHTLCKYLIELTVMDMKLLKYPPSSLAAGAVYIARKMTGKAPLWTPTLAHYTTLSEADVREVALEMNALLKKTGRSTLKAIKKKYALPKYGEVANMAIVDL